MISYAPFYRTLLEKGVTEYHLIYKQGFSANILHRMKHGKTITLKTLDTLLFQFHKGTIRTINNLWLIVRILISIP